MRGIRKELESLNIFYCIGIFGIMVALIIVATGSYMYYELWQNVHGDFLTANEDYLNAIASRHEADMEVLDNIGIQISLSDGVTNFFLGEQPIKSTRLIEQLYQYSVVSNFFSMLLYGYHEDQYLYNQKTSIRADTFSEEAFILENVDAAQMRDALYAEDIKMQVFAEQKVTGRWTARFLTDANVIVYIKTVAPKNKGSLMFVVPSSYYDELMAEASEKQRTDFIIYDDVCIVMRGAKLEEAELVSLVRGLDDGGHRAVLGRNKYLLSVLHGDSGLIYCTLQPMEIFYDKILADQWVILLLMLVCAAPATFVIAVFTRKLALRIRRMNSILDLKGEAEYNLQNIENGIRLLAESGEAKEKENRQFKKTIFIRNFIRNDFLNKEAALQAAKDCTLEINYPIYLIALLGERGGNKENEAHMKMLEIIRKAPSLDGYGIRLVSNNQSLFVLFGHTQEQIEGVLEQLFAVGKEYYEEFVMAVSGWHRDIMEGSKAYLEANTALDNRFLQDNDQIIRYGDVENTDYLNILPESYLWNLRKAIKNRDKEETAQAIENICTKMTNGKSSLMAFRLLYNDIIHIMITEWQGSAQNAESIYNVFALSQCLSVRDLNDLLLEACNAIIDNRPLEKCSESDTVQRAMEYMKAHFRDPELTMSVLSEYLGISSVTLSIEFKNSTGMRPSDYLANLRMEYAKELLVTTDLRIWEISAAVCYEDDHAFTRRFKKYTGETPGQYRERRHM